MSAVKSEAWENLKAKIIDFSNSIRQVNEYEKYIWTKYLIFSRPPLKKKILKNIIVYFEYMPERVQLLGLGHKFQLTPIDLCPP